MYLPVVVIHYKNNIDRCFSAYVDAEHYPERNIVVVKNTALSSQDKKTNGKKSKEES